MEIYVGVRCLTIRTQFLLKAIAVFHTNGRKYKLHVTNCCSLDFYKTTNEFVKLIFPMRTLGALSKNTHVYNLRVRT